MITKACPKTRSQHLCGFSSTMGVANSVVMTCPKTLAVIQKVKQVACCIQHEQLLIYTGQIFRIFQQFKVNKRLILPPGMCEESDIKVYSCP